MRGFIRLFSVSAAHPGSFPHGLDPNQKRGSPHPVPQSGLQCSTSMTADFAPAGCRRPERLSLVGVLHTFQMISVSVAESR